jgi:hypothetical protein
MRAIHDLHKEDIIDVNTKSLHTLTAWPPFFASSLSLSSDYEKRK